MTDNDPNELLAARLRDACIDALIDAYEDAGVRGLCGDGRWEAAVGAVRSLQPRELLRQAADRASRPAS